MPAGTTWAEGFPHTAWFDMSQYYITAFKTGYYPPITVRTYAQTLNAIPLIPILASSKTSSITGPVPTQPLLRLMLTAFPRRPVLIGLRCDSRMIPCLVTDIRFSGLFMGCGVLHGRR